MKTKHHWKFVSKNKADKDAPENTGALDYEKEAEEAIASRNRRKKGKRVIDRSLPLLIAVFALGMIFLELFYHIFAYGEVGSRIYMPIVFGLFGGTVFGFFALFFRGKGRSIYGITVFALMGIFFSAQLVYFHIFGTSLSLSQFGMGGDAVTSFWRELIAALGDIWFQFLVLFLPSVLFFIVMHFFRPLRRPVFHWKNAAVSLGFVFAAYALTLCLLLVGGTSAYSCYDLYHSSAMSTDLSVKGLGVMTTARLEIKYMTFGSDEDLSDVLGKNGEKELSDTDIYNMIDIDFDAMAAQETNEDVKALDEYFATASATKKNDYTGYFEGYNLIELCCESFSPVFIDKDLTPMLYKMYHNGFVFKNFYSPWESNTTNGEYTMCMGNFPDNSRSKNNGSFKASADHYLPFCLGNMFRSIGVPAYGYHNYEGYFYCRSYTYPNIGLDSKFAEDGMTFSNSWPASDLEMMEQSVPDYIKDPQFFVHYMTFSGHYRYERATNAMVVQNWDKVENLDYSDAVKSYISCNLELEYAMENLVKQLEDAGIADKTVIAMTCDHFPYGLTIDQYSELAGHEVDEDFGKYKNAFILWNPTMEEKVVVKDSMCTVDILPTLLNLWGMNYDSRLLTGKDIFSNAAHIAILSNGSFITDKIRYNSSTGEVEYLVDESQVTDSYIQNWVEEVKRRFTISTEILNTDYYRYIQNYLDINDVLVDTADINSFNNTAKNPNQTNNNRNTNWGS